MNNLKRFAVYIACGVSSAAALISCNTGDVATGAVVGGVVGGVLGRSTGDQMQTLQHYGFSQTSAQQFLDNVELAKAGDISGLEQLGLNSQELEQLGQLQMPSDQGIETFAANLNISKQQAKKIFKDFLHAAKAQYADINSPLWEMCMANGSWQTNKNLYCEQTWWDGCSPETGATQCVPK